MPSPLCNPLSKYYNLLATNAVNMQRVFDISRMSPEGSIAVLCGGAPAPNLRKRQETSPTMCVPPNSLYSAFKTQDLASNIARSKCLKFLPTYQEIRSVTVHFLAFDA